MRARYNPFQEPKVNAEASSSKVSQDCCYDVFNSDFYKQQMEAVVRAGNSADVKVSTDYVNLLIADAKVRETADQGYQSPRPSFGSSSAGG